MSGTVPAQECLDRLDPTRLGAELWLVGQTELVALVGQAQVGQQREIVCGEVPGVATPDVACLADLGGAVSR